MILYSVQGRTGVNIEPATVTRLARNSTTSWESRKLPEMSRRWRTILDSVPEEFLGAFRRRRADAAVDGAWRARHDFCGVERNSGGDDATDATVRWQAISRPRARLQRQYLPLMEVNFVESNPIPVKAAMAMMGLLEPVWRLPLVPPKAENQAKIRACAGVTGAA